VAHGLRPGSDCAAFAAVGREGCAEGRFVDVRASRRKQNAAQARLGEDRDGEVGLTQEDTALQAVASMQDATRNAVRSQAGIRDVAGTALLDRKGLSLARTAAAAVARPLGLSDLAAGQKEAVALSDPSVACNVPASSRVVDRGHRRTRLSP
jgi:hypothetical protein